MSSPIRIAVFLCDAPPPSVQATEGDYTAIFNTLLRSALPQSPPSDFVLDPYDVRNKLEYPEDVDAYAAIILTGSAASAYENLEWINRLVSYVASVAQDKPLVKLIGICFGHQIIGRALGGDCVPNEGRWEVGVTEVELTPLGQDLFGVPTLNIQEMHCDHVPAVPSNLELLGSTPVALNQGMVRFLPGPRSVENVQILTVQGHPEFTRRIVDVLVDTREKTGVLSAKVADDARRRAGWRNDGVDVVGKTIWRVLGVPAS
ncbi:class I glutamine amidotransferase-like protein [Amylocystis lapponica]|nr:class I glutamine amidotransferase-like protein [Amylocystis lapponica]